MIRSLEWYQQVYKLISNTEITLVMLLMGWCFSVLIRPFLQRKKTVIFTGIIVAICGNVLLWLLHGGGVGIYIFVMLIAFCTMYFLEKEKPLQKVFLCVIFLALRYLSSAVNAEWGFFSLWIDLNTDHLGTTDDVNLLLLDFILGQILSLILHILILYLMVRLFTKTYKHQEELSIRELGLLLIPAAAPLLESAIFREYLRIYNQGIEDGFIKQNIPPNFIRFLFYVFSYFAILMVVLFYEQVRKERDEKAQSEALEKEISGMHQTIEHTRQLYEQVRTLRHDISNHLMTMERLTDNDSSAEAKHYLSRLKEEYSATLEGIRCGDPVIDVVLTGKRDIAVQKGIDFNCDFLFPSQPVIDVFDLSVLLNNAIDNALRGASGDHRWISITTGSHEQFFTIIIRNSFDGRSLSLDTDGLPISTKPGEGHGLGIKLIRRIALTYHGDIEFIRRDTEVELRVLLHHKDPETV